MKIVLKGKGFADVEEVKTKKTPAEAVKGINIYAFKICFEQWGRCLARCIASNGEYFEGG